MLLVLCGRAAAAERPLVAGHVRDDSGHMLPGISVRLHAPDGPVVETATDESGWYRLDAAPGPYELRFSLVNFGEVTKHIVVAADVPLTVNAVLPLAFTADDVVTGRRTFRSIGEVPDPAENLIGVAGAASEGPSPRNSFRAGGSRAPPKSWRRCQGS